MTLDARLHIRKGAFTLSAEFSTPNHGVTAIEGPSGAGKTILLRAVAGLEKQSGNTLRVGETVWQDDITFVPVHQRSVGYVFQDARLFAHLSVRDNLNYGFQRHSKLPENRADIDIVSFDEAVNLLGVGPLLERHPVSLSGGEQKRVAIARAILAQPKIMLLDEPLSGLDRNSQQDILPFLEQVHQRLNIPILYVSHAADELARLADHVVLLRRGQVIGTGPVDDILTRPDLPLSQAEQAEALIHATVAGYDPTYQLISLEFSGGRFTVAGDELPSGREVRLRVLARDVSLTLAPQTETSILNIFPAVIESISDYGKAQVVVRLNLKGTPLLARVTRKSIEALKLETGASCYAQVKSVAVLI